jgi:hypothetical protein
MAAGLVAAAGMLGVLIGLGRRAGTTWRPVNAAAHPLLGGMADGVWAFHGNVTLVGGLVVLTMSLLAGVGTARLAGSLEMKKVVAAAAGLSLSAYLIHVHVAARSPGGLSDVLSIGEMRALYVTLALTLVAGLRFAFSAGQGRAR